MDIDTEWTSEPVCPHCGHAHRDWWESDVADAGDGDTVTAECDACGEAFAVRVHRMVRFDSAKAAWRGDVAGTEAP